ncbi:MAG: hypothetical protein RMJ05_03675 [Thermomicrobium sp.]|nr:hypothetical protein [Thermomicrobium sp.]MDW8005798.1 hypothetical protein [Thermomicrobium sp.]
MKRSAVRVLFSVAVFVVAFAYAPAVVAQDGVAESPEVWNLVQRLAVQPDPAEAFARLDPEEQKRVADYLTTGTLVVTPILGKTNYTVTGERCVTRGTSAVFYVANGAAWTYTLMIQACDNGVRITRWNTWRTVDVAWWAVGWRFVGDIQQVSFLGPNATYVYAYRQGHFQWCVGSFGCFSDRYPWAWHRIYVNGSWQYGSGGT